MIIIAFQYTTWNPQRHSHNIFSPEYKLFSTGNELHLTAFSFLKKLHIKSCRPNPDLKLLCVSLHRVCAMASRTRSSVFLVVRSPRTHKKTWLITVLCLHPAAVAVSVSLVSVAARSPWWYRKPWWSRVGPAYRKKEGSPCIVSQRWDSHANPLRSLKKSSKRIDI